MTEDCFRNLFFFPYVFRDGVLKDGLHLEEFAILFSTRICCVRRVSECQSKSIDGILIDDLCRRTSTGRATLRPSEPLLTPATFSMTTTATVRDSDVTGLHTIVPLPLLTLTRVIRLVCHN